MSPAPPPRVDASGEETPKGPRRSRRRLGCVQSSQCGGSGEPRVVWDCQSPDQIPSAAAAVGATKPGRRLSPGKLTDQLDPAEDGGKICGQPETPPLVRIWLRERKTAVMEAALPGGEANAPNHADGRVARSPLRSLNGPARKLRRAIVTAAASDRSRAPAAAAAVGCSAFSSSTADSAADAELFGKLAAVVYGQRSDVSIPVSSSPGKCVVNGSPDASFVIPPMEDTPGWSDQSSFGEASFSNAVADGGSPGLRAASPTPPAIASCTMRVRRLQTTSFPPAMDVDVSPRASVLAGRRFTDMRSAAGRVVSLAGGTSHADLTATDNGSKVRIGGASLAPTKVMATSRIAADAAASSPRVPLSAPCSAATGLRRSPRLLTVGDPSDQRSQLRSASDVSAPVVMVGQAVSTIASADSATAYLAAAGGGVRRQLHLLTAGCDSAAMRSTASTSKASTAASSLAVPRAVSGPSASAVGSLPPETATHTNAEPRPLASSTGAGASCQATATLPAHVPQVPPRGGVQSRPAGAPAKLVNLWDSRHRSSVVLGKSAASAAAGAEMQPSSATDGQPSATGSLTGASNTCSQGSSAAAGRCSSEEIARKKREAQERRMRKVAASAAVPASCSNKGTTGSFAAAAAASECITPATVPLTSMTEQAVRTSTRSGSSLSNCTIATGGTSLATASAASSAAATADTAFASIGGAASAIVVVASATATTVGGSSSQGRTRCSLEEIARKRDLALERKRAAARAVQQ